MSTPQTLATEEFAAEAVESMDDVGEAGGVTSAPLYYRESHMKQERPGGSDRSQKEKTLSVRRWWRSRPS